MKTPIKNNSLAGPSGGAGIRESSLCPTIANLVRHRRTDSNRLAWAVRSFFPARFRWWMLTACLVVPLTRSSAQVRLGLLMPTLNPQPVIAPYGPPPSLMPGQTLTFANADAVEGTNIPAFLGATGYKAGETPLRAFAFSIQPLQSSSASAFQYNDVAIPASTVPGGVADSVVSAQISGSLSVRGFLYALGASEAKAAVDIEVLDITDTNAPPLVVSSRRIAEYEADSESGVSVGGDVDVHGMAGFPYVGVDGGGGIKIGLELKPVLVFVRDDKTFGFMALLRRGHVYRVQTDLSVDTSERIFGGTAIASFYSPSDGGPVIPNIFDPTALPDTPGAENSWLSLLKPMTGSIADPGSIPDLQIRKGMADVVSRSLNIAGISYETSIWNNSDTEVVGGLFGFLSPNEAAKTYHAYDLLNVISPKLPLTLEELVTNSPFLHLHNAGTFEPLPLPGVAVAGPTITLGNDEVALAAQATDLAIEEHLMRNDDLVSLYLPAAFGGQLERCTALVSHFIAESKAAGYPTKRAEKHLALALQAQGQGEYKFAYKQLHMAYVRVAGEARGEAKNP